MQLLNRKIRWLKFLICCSLFFCLHAFAETKTILILGDNLSTEHEMESGTGWVSLLEQRLQSRYPDYSIVNVSVAGETTASGNTHLPRFLAEYNPEIVIIELGVNDGFRHVPISAVQQNLRTMIRASLKTGSQVLVLGIPIPKSYGQDYSRQFSAIYEQITNETNSELVPNFLKGLNPRDMDDFNQIHFSKEAQPVLLENVWTYLLPLLK